MLRLPYLAFVSTLALTGCTGLALGENNPGQDTWLGNGAIAVDDRTETSFVLASDTEDPAQPEKIPASTLFAIDPDTGLVREAANLTGRDDPRLLFPASGLLVMSEESEKDRLDLFDQETLALKKSVELDIRYHGTRMSPSRSFIGVADNTSEKFPIHVIEADTLDRHVIPHDGEWLEAVFLNKSDTLVAIVFYDQGKPTPRARLLGWSMQELAIAGYPLGPTGFWAAPVFDIEVPGIAWDLSSSFTWIGTSPDDKYIVFPVRKAEVQPDDKIVYTHELLVLDPGTKELREVPGARGPVGFTPDGSTIVSYGDQDMNGNQELWLVDAETLEVDPEPVTIEGGISYFVSRDGNFIVVASSNGEQQLVLYDVDQDRSTQMEGPGVGLEEFVSRVGRKEMWIVDNQSLFRLDLAAGEIAEVETTFTPEHVNILPTRDRLVLDDADSNDIVFFDPNDKSVKTIVALPVGKTSP
ncbi:hypothetical protein [Polyangium jinanense]|uniref:Uncharacterized protein n=1 Tax=Polyangium jinanense TaxID=2829994 RepID=A0A9X4AWY9_9BACT|nr:hypothetical protein [Polyangium jinanense]MDC3962876.1 hypothetical protein [Polyangium jinanense]MDC3987844.1 hypothetical protein [Polyangium jinanense]